MEEKCVAAQTEDNGRLYPKTYNCFLDNMILKDRLYVFINLGTNPSPIKMNAPRHQCFH